MIEKHGRGDGGGAPYTPDHHLSHMTRRCPSCKGLLTWIYHRKQGRVIVQEQWRCTRCRQITEIRLTPKGAKR